MATFNHLPFEIRARIWKLTVEPRTVEVSIFWGGGERGNVLFSTTPVPAPLQVCHEARNIALYKQAFSEVGDERRYVWLNLDIDMVSFGTCPFEGFKLVAPLIKRLKFQRENQDEGWYYFESKEIRNFVNAKEIHVVCQDGCWEWDGAMVEHAWPCAAENIFFIDLDEGLVVNGIELQKMCDEDFEAAQRRVDEEYEEETRELLADMTTL